MINRGHLIDYADLGWLEHERGNLDTADRLLTDYLRLDDDPDEMTAIVSGLLGSWRWDRFGTVDAEPLLRAGTDVDPRARADLAELLVASERSEEVELTRRGRDGEADEWLRLAAAGGDKKALTWLAERDE